MLSNIKKEKTATKIPPSWISYKKGRTNIKKIVLLFLFSFVFVNIKILKTIARKDKVITGHEKETPINVEAVILATGLSEYFLKIRKEK